MRTIILSILFLLVELGIGTNAIATQKEHDKSACLYPANPINWISKYCSLIVGTDDEITIQDSKCFKDAARDLKTRDDCITNKNYKTKTCELLIKEKLTDHSSIEQCLKDKKVKPFFAGE